MTAQAIQKALDFLAKTQNDDGGWGYEVGDSSVTEPTALAVVAQGSETASENGLSWLLGTQRDDGGWGLHSQDDGSNWHTARAAWALLTAAVDHGAQAVELSVDWLLDEKVVRLTDSGDIADIMGLLSIDPTLAGWPWQPGEAPFVDPTGLSMLALVAAGLGDHPRVAEGAAYLRDRACQMGGWNVGNPFMFDKPLLPTPNSTALALLALRAVRADKHEPILANGLDALRATLRAEVAASSLAWGIMAFRAWGDSVTSLSDRLLRMQSGNGGWGDSPYATASAVLALQEPDAAFAFGS